MPHNHRSSPSKSSATPATNAAPRPPGTSPPSSKSEWSQGTQSILDSLPQRWSRSLVYAMIGFTGLALPWAMVARIDEVGTAQGRLEPLGQTIQLDAVAGGRVAAVNAAEGDRVTAGQSLLDLNSENLRTELLQAQTRLDGQINRFNQQDLLMVQLEQSLQTQTLRNQAQASEQQSQIRQIQQQLNSQAQDLNWTQEILSQDVDQAERYYGLYSSGILSRNEAQNFGRTALETGQRQHQAEGQIAQSQVELQKQQVAYNRILREGELANLDTQRQLQQLMSQQVTLESEIRQTRNQIQALEQQWQQRAIIVPTSGTLFQLAVQHPGAVLQPGQTVARIAPEGTPLILRAQISARESGFLKLDLPVKLKFDAYPYQDYGIVPGHISWISPDSRPAGSDAALASDRPPDTPDSPGGIYDLEITIPNPQVSDGITTIALSPGQTAQAEILIRQRRIIDLIIDPFKQMRSRGMQL